MLAELLGGFERIVQPLRFARWVDAGPQSRSAVPDGIRCGLGFNEESGEIEVLDLFFHGQPPLRWKTLGSEG